MLTAAESGGRRTGVANVPWVASLVAAVIAGNAWMALHPAWRLRRSLAEDISILKELPEGPARDELLRHVERDTRRMVAYAEPLTGFERAGVDFGAFLLGAAVAAPLVAALLAPEKPQVVRGAVLLSIVLITVGWVLVAQMHGRRTARRDAVLKRLEAPDELQAQPTNEPA